MPNFWKDPLGRRTTISEEDYDKGEIELRRMSPREERQRSPHFLYYLAIAMVLLILVSLLFLFYTVVPMVGFIIYQNLTLYFWEPMKFAPLGPAAIIVFLIWLFGDSVKPIIRYKDDKAWYRSKYEVNGNVHFRRMFHRGEIIVYEKRVAGNSGMKSVTAMNLDVVYSGNDILVEGRDLTEVSEIRILEKRLASKDRVIAVLTRENEALRSQNTYIDRVMRTVEASGRSEQR